MTTSTHTLDYLKRKLQNEIPGTTDPVLDFIGRETTADTDYMGRPLTDPEPGTIEGTITAAIGLVPIVGATVTAGEEEATTDADGHYTIAGLNPGTYTVTATATGYESAEQEDVIVTSGTTTTVDIELATAI
jgi:hypothetical protein